MPYVGSAKQLADVHPFAPLSANEITTSAQILRQSAPRDTDIHFKAITLLEPKKEFALPYLAAERAGKPRKPLERRSFILYYIRFTGNLYESVVNLSTEKVESKIRLGPNVHANSDGGELLEIEKVALEDEGVKAEIAKLQLPEGTVVVCEPWIYGSDGVNEGAFSDEKRLYQCYLYLRDPNNSSEADSNHYAFPLAISPVISADSLKVVRIDIIPTGADNTIKEPSPYKVHPPNEYIHEAQNLRTDVKPLRVIQPEGASFKVHKFSEQGSALEWQKWDFKVGFNYREGMVLYDVHYDGRPLFYRISLSDMNIPYGDPRSPYHRKAAFDLGDVGAGLMANNLKLGCDCLGSIQYLSGVLSDDKGAPLYMDNVICIHEQDNGIGWKHTNYRTGRAAVARNRELVLQTILTVANYEYILAFMFNQAGELTYEVRATGILSTQPIDEGISVPWGTIVHPGVLATHHQHILSLRIDPMLDGPLNRLAYEEAHPMARSTFNPHGIGYTTTETVIRESSGQDQNWDHNRTFKIQNAASLNPINHKPVAYKIHATPFQKMLADKDSFHHRRAEFADHNIYVTKYVDGELYAGGKYTNQSRGGTGVRSFANRRDNVVDEDIVVWVQLGINHVPRIEDFPVMPVEIIKMSLKPVNFFTRNPALDVPPSEQSVNQSTLLGGEGRDPVAVVGDEGEVCCVKESSKL